MLFNFFAVGLLFFKVLFAPFYCRDLPFAKKKTKILSFFRDLAVAAVAQLQLLVFGRKTSTSGWKSLLYRKFFRAA